MLTVISVANLNAQAQTVSPMTELLRKANAGDANAQYQVGLQFLLGIA